MILSNKMHIAFVLKALLFVTFGAPIIVVNYKNVSHWKSKHHLLHYSLAHFETETMKKILLLLLVLLSLPATSRGESVFDLELECARRTLHCGRTNYVLLQFAQFQEAALLYLQDKQQHTRDVARINREWLDVQALNMSDFLSLYYMGFVDENISSEEHEVLQLIFRDASLTSPCFYDDNEEKVLRFVAPDESSITPFSLDTDWKTAYQKVKKELNQSKFQWLLQQYLAMRKQLSGCDNDV